MIYDKEVSLNCTPDALNGSRVVELHCKGEENTTSTVSYTVMKGY